MVEFLQLPEKTRRTLIEQANTSTAIPVKAIEKDWWVTLVLKALFSLPMSEHFVFKGGTSLSKGWKLIERFSEDIDIALAPEAFGRIYQQTPSISYVKRLKKEGCHYTSTVIKDSLEASLLQMGVPPEMLRIEAEAINPLIPDKDPQTIFVHFTSLFEASHYLADFIKVEFGVRALKEPFTNVEIESIISAATSTPAYREEPFNVTTVEPRKTLMEKIILLHEKFLTGRMDGDAAIRQSRHLSDIFQLRKNGIVEQMLGDTDLYAVLLHHRRHYIRLRDVNYDAMQLQQLSFLPPWQLVNSFRKDYEDMLAEMIYGDPPDFDALLNELRALNIRLASLGHGRDVQAVIAEAARQIPDHVKAPSFVIIPMTYVSDPYLPEGPANSPIQFEVEFLVGESGIRFHRIRVI